MNSTTTPRLTNWMKETRNVRMTARCVYGYCVFCGAVRIIPSYPVNELAPTSESTCSHY